jgi:hypothetical protein
MFHKPLARRQQQSLIFFIIYFYNNHFCFTFILRVLGAVPAAAILKDADGPAEYKLRLSI